jgi:hypothetical protein
MQPTKKTPRPARRVAGKKPSRKNPSLMDTVAGADADTFVCDDAFFDRLFESSDEDYGAFLASDFHAALSARVKD